LTEPRHGDPLDYPDIPGDSGLSAEYDEATMSPGVKAAIAKRKAEKFSTIVLVDELTRFLDSLPKARRP
jgi:hypothetical protein